MGIILGLLIQYVEKHWGYPGEYCPLGGSKAKNSWGLRPLGFLALELPRDNILQFTPLAFPKNVSDPLKVDFLAQSKLIF